tara:strand:+ start:35546 stop:37027 length:1482 start_codon:yes stop_codon:yes gene_type:complete
LEQVLNDIVDESMKILLTGANGYIGKRLLFVLVEKGHFVYACVREKNTLHLSTELKEQVELVEVDFLVVETLNNLPKDIDVAYYLMHSLTAAKGSFSEKEIKIANNFKGYIDQTEAKQIIYLGGISNDENLSEHLKSRQHTEELLANSKVSLTTLRAAIIIGSGGASFEIIRDLVEKLPVMIAPKWLDTKCQPIGIRNVVEYLTGCLGNEKTYNKTFDIGGPEVLTYKEMLLKFAEVREMKRYIVTVPVMTPKLSSYWLYFVTSTSYQIASNLVESMKNEVVVKLSGIEEIIPINLMSYKENVALAFQRIKQNHVLSSWVDSDFKEAHQHSLNSYIEVPDQGVFQDVQKVDFDLNEQTKVANNLWAIGGQRGWYYGNWLWKIRGYMDKFVGGVGLRRGRRSPTELFPGDSLDFWRVLLADDEKKRLLLFAEMKLPGEAWLEFKIEHNNEKTASLVQTATFRPKGLYGRLYWYSVLPFHGFIFKNMAKNIVHYR